MRNCDLFLHESDYPELDASAAVAHLSRAIQFETTSYVDTTRIRYEEFDALHDWLRQTYTDVLAAGSCEEIGHSLLITLPGSDAMLRPALLMAHQDVVPVVPGTQERWLHAPFSGDVADGMIWGRGAMDIKQMLVGILEAAHTLLGRGERLKRTLYLAFGEDEETRSTGARAIAQTLKARGVQLEFVLDEGAGDVMDAGDYGAPDALVCPIGIYEKGYADMRLTARSRGGHSSNPFRGTSLGALAKAISQITEHMPPPRLSDAVRQSLVELRPFITEEPMRAWTLDIDAHEAELLDWFSAHESLYHLVRTTAAPTMIRGGSQAGNVMPQDMEAVINFRLCPWDTPESLLAHCKALVGDGVELSYVQKISASTPSRTDRLGYERLKATLERYFDRLRFIPMQNRGATDARNYESICDCVLRFGPFLEEEDISQEGIHGTNERISVRAYLQGIRVLIHLIETTCL
ncbi:MAG: M20/M25/M40 family metallo-hydrolase [Clostridia bacterium]|nr:M20/M25/M40 family metallo-hydrolase [Clostridia bacterium]